MDASLAPDAPRSAAVLDLVAGAAAAAGLGVLGCELSFWGLVLSAREVVGEWPHASSGNPFDGSWVEASIDPKQLGLHATWAFLGTFFALPTLAVLAAAFAGLGLARDPRRVRRGAYLALLLALPPVAWHLVADPGGFVLWLRD